METVIAVYTSIAGVTFFSLLFVLSDINDINEEEMTVTDIICKASAVAMFYPILIPIAGILGLKKMYEDCIDKK